MTIRKSLFQGVFFLLLLLVFLSSCTPKATIPKHLTDMVLQDANLWLCGEQQVSRVDLSTDRVENIVFPCKKLLKGENGWIWAYSSYRLGVYDGSTWTEFTNIDTTSPEIKVGEINFLSQTADGTIWVSSRQLSAFHPQSGGWEVVIPAPPTSDSSDCTFCVVTKPGYIGPVFESADRAIWLNEQDRGIARWYQNSKQIWSNNDGLSNLFPTAFMQSQDESIWVGTLDGINHFQDMAWHAWKFNSVDSETDKVLDIIESKGNQVWIALKSGLMMWDGSTWKRIGNFTEPRSLIQTSNGDIWIGFDNQGAVRYNGKNLLRYSTQLRTFQETQNHQLFGGGKEGLFLYDSNSDQWKPYLLGQ